MSNLNERNDKCEFCGVIIWQDDHNDDCPKRTPDATEVDIDFYD